MPLRVATMMQYLTAQVEQMRSSDFDALMVVKAVKGIQPGGIPTSLTLFNVSYSFSNDKPDGAVELWIAWSTHYLKQLYPNQSIVIVPVPNTSAVYNTPPNFRTAELAMRIAKALGTHASVAHELWFKTSLKKASEGGPRFAEDIYPHLVGIKSNQVGHRVLLDDILTSGGHLMASAAKLRELGHSPMHAICCGRTSHVQYQNPFHIPIEELPDYDPGNKFEPKIGFPSL